MLHTISPELLALFALGGLLFMPLLTGVLAVTENLRAGCLPLQRRLCGVLWLGLARAFFNSVWTLWLTALVLPLGLLPRHASTQRHHGIPVLLVHGLYHNRAAWLLFRRRLARAGLPSVRSYSYPSFGRSFADIAAGLAQEILAASQASPDGRVQLVGHSLGGLLIRAACADARVQGDPRCRVAGVVTLGTPHQGSTLAGMLGLGRLARGLAPQGEALRLLRGLPAAAPGLSLYSPTDGMVLPLSGSLLEQKEKDAGWTEVCLRPVSHVGLLYSGEAAQLALAHLKSRLARPGA